MASSALFLNFYTTTRSASLSSTATTMSVSSTTGLPSSLASGQFIPMTLTPASSPGSAYEIVYVTGISGSTLTVERGQEGTSALNWNASDIVFSTNTAETTASIFGLPYDIASGVSGPIGASQYVLFFIAPRIIDVPSNFSGSYAEVLTAFTSAATYTIYHNGTSVGTISFSASGTSGTFSTATAFTMNPGDTMTIQAPSTADATAANLAITIKAISQD